MPEVIRRPHHWRALVLSVILLVPLQVGIALPARADQSGPSSCQGGSGLIGSQESSLNAHCDPVPGDDSSPPGRAGGEESAEKGSGSGDGALGRSPDSGQSEHAAPICSWLPVEADEPHAVPSFPGEDLATGRIEKKVCGAPPGDQSGLGSAIVDWRFTRNTADQQPVAPPPDPAVLAVEASKNLRVPSPTISYGPSAKDIVVQIPTWLWVDDPGQLSASVSAGTVTVTASARLSSTTWTLGEPDRNPSFTGYRSGPAVTVTCQGAGAPPPSDVDWKAEPVCGHTFRWRSLPERTGGSGKWPITATTSWNVTWQSNTGQSGTMALTATSQDSVAVGEYRILLVDGGR